MTKIILYEGSIETIEREIDKIETEDASNYGFKVNEILERNGFGRPRYIRMMLHEDGSLREDFGSYTKFIAIYGVNNDF